MYLRERLTIADRVAELNRILVLDNPCARSPYKRNTFSYIGIALCFICYDYINHLNSFAIQILKLYSNLTEFDPIMKCYLFPHKICMFIF